MITYLISSNLCEMIHLQCYRLYNFPSFRSSHWRCSARKSVLRNFAKLTGNHLWQSLFFNKVAFWGYCFWFSSCLLLKIFCLSHLNRKMKWKKGNTWWTSNIYFFARVSICLTPKISKKNSTDGNLIRKCVDVAVFMVRGISLVQSF